MKDNKIILNKLKTKQPNLFDYFKYRKFIMSFPCHCNKCSDCSLDKWCDYHMHFQEPFDQLNCFWFINIKLPIKNWFSKTILKNKIYVCSVCGLMEKPIKGSICDEYGWRKKKGIYICHHCAYHQYDDYDISEQGELFHISHEAYQRRWQYFVEENNKKYERKQNNGT